MSPDRDKEFEQNVSQLIHLLQKIVKGIPSEKGLSNPKFPSNENGVQINIHFFSFFPLSDEEWESIEDMYDSYPYGADEGREEKLTTDLNSDDIDFLKKNGISF